MVSIVMHRHTYLTDYHQFEQARVVDRNVDSYDLPTNSPNTQHAVSSSAIAVIRSYSTSSALEPSRDGTACGPDAIPELLCLADLEVRIPRLEILAMERLADRDGKSVDAVLARELLDVVSAHSEYLATAIPGFTAALRWPQ